MAEYNGNNVYLDIDGTEIHSYFINVTLSPSVATVDVTRGAGATHIARAAGLKDTSASIQIGYDDSNASTIMTLFGMGKAVTLTYGPEGNTAGKPKHVQSFIVTGAPHTVSVTKDAVVWDISLEAAAAPTTDMYAGGVWP